MERARPITPIIPVSLDPLSRKFALGAGFLGCRSRSPKPKPKESRTTRHGSRSNLRLGSKSKAASSQKGRNRLQCLCTNQLLTRSNSARGANIGTSAAVYARIGVNRVLFALGDCAGGTFIDASAACDAVVANYVSHCSVFLNCYYYVGCRLRGKNTDFSPQKSDGPHFLSFFVQPQGIWPGRSLAQVPHRHGKRVFWGRRTIYAHFAS